MALESISSVVWAINPFDEDPRALKELARSLKALRVNKINPVFVMSPNSFISIKEIQKEPSARFPRDEMIKLLKSLEVETEEPEVLSTQEPSIGAEVDEVLDYSQKIKAPLIACATHARKTWPRIVMGSFAEKLLQRAQQACLFSNPKVEAKEEIQKIFFPCDFGSEAKKNFKKALGVAKQTGSNLYVFHAKVPYTLYQEYNIVGLDLWKPYIGPGRVNDLDAKIQDFKKIASEAQVELQVELGEESARPKDAILNKIEKLQPQLIVAGSRIHKGGPFLVGSTITKLVRESHCPVLVFKKEV